MGPAFRGSAGIWRGETPGRFSAIFSAMPSVAVKLPRISIQEYYRIEREAVEKSDWLDGEMYNMSGGTTDHSQIKTNLTGMLHNKLRGKECRLLDSDQRLKIPATGLRTYPDASVYCDPIEYDDEDEQAHTATNPTAVFEVISPPTEAYDRGLKRESYRQLESLKAYVLVSHDHPHVEAYVRQAHGNWLLREVRGMDAEIPVTAIGVTLKLADLYERVTFGKPDDEEAPASG